MSRGVTRSGPGSSAQAAALPHAGHAARPVPDRAVRAARPWWAGWRYAAEGARDLRLDLLRGFAVFAMVVDHVGGSSWLHAITGGNRFFVSAAEGFVFLSGLVVGIVYGGVARAQGFRAVAARLLARAWLLYVLAVWLALGSALLAVVLGQPAGTPFLLDPARFVFEIVTLQRTFYLVDVLLLYCFAMVAAIGAFAALARGHWWLVLLASWGLWGAAQAAPGTIAIPWPVADNPVFGFAPWQVLFFTALVLGYGRRWLAANVAARWPRSPLRDGYLVPLGLAFAALVWLSVTDAAALGRFAPGGDAAALLDAWFLKSHLPLPRLLACALVFGFFWALVTRCWRPLRALAGPLLLPLGQRALYAYAAHIFLVALVGAGATALWAGGPGPDSPALGSGPSAALQLATLALLWALTQARLFEGSLAPLGRPPAVRTAPRPGQRFAWRPSDALVAIALAGTISAAYPLTHRYDGGAGAAGTAPRGARAGMATAALPISTVTAPRKVGGTVTAPTAAAPAAPAAATATAVAAGQTRDGSFYSPTLGRTLSYGLYLPPGYDGATARYPVLYMLHGIGGHYSEWAAYGLLETAERLIVAGRIEPLIIVLPQGDESYFVNHAGADGARWGDYLASDLVAYIDATYRTIPGPATRAIGGLSMGGFGALSLAFARPEVFGVVGAHSPSLRTQAQSPGYLGDPAAFARIDPMQLARELDPARAPRIWIDVGIKDTWATRTTALKDELRARGILPEYHETAGGHDNAYWRQNAARYLRFYAAAFAATEPD